MGEIGITVELEENTAKQRKDFLLNSTGEQSSGKSNARRGVLRALTMVAVSIHVGLSKLF